MPLFKFDVKSNLKTVLFGLNKAVEDSLNEIGDAIVHHAHDLAPVDTGRLQDSYIKDVDAGKSRVRVGSPLDWAAYVELGTGPYYQTPPGWIDNFMKRGYHTTAPWWYFDDYYEEWRLGGFVRAQPHLRPAFLNYVNEYIRICKRNLGG